MSILDDATVFCKQTFETPSARNLWNLRSVAIVNIQKGELNKPTGKLDFYVSVQWQLIILLFISIVLHGMEYMQ